MKKWIIAITLVLLFAGAQAQTADATNDNIHAAILSAGETEAPLFDVLVPLKDRVTSRETIMVSFRAPRNSLVTVEVFHDNSLTEEPNFEALYEPMKFEIGILERGWVELGLKKGVNRIVFTRTLPDQNEGEEPVVEVIERRITVKDLEEVREELTRNVMQTSATDLIRRLTNME